MDAVPEQDAMSKEQEVAGNKKQCPKHTGLGISLWAP